MHLLIDIRSSGATDRAHIRYALLWADYWKQIHPQDTITFLCYEGDHIHRDNVITISRKWSLFGNKNLSNHSHGPDRILQFSSLPPIDPSIPTVSHIFDAADFLYPREALGYFSRKREANTYKKIIADSREIIVPHTNTGMELIELFDANEEKMNVIPFFIPPYESGKKSVLAQYTINPGYWITEGTPGSEWNPIGLLHAFSKYIHELAGTKKLLILGDMGENLGHITEYIRGLDLMEHVRIMGILPEDDHASLYEHMDGWLYVGPYYSAGTHLALAKSYEKPILVADIPLLRDYSYVRIHPNHTDELPETLKSFETSLYENTEVSIDNEAIMNVYQKILAKA